MRSLDELDPVAALVCIFSVTGAAMFSRSPIVTGICLAGGLLYFIVRNGTRHARSHLWLLAMFIVFAAINPLVSHNGATVLLVVNDSPITLEALLYGVNSAAAVVGVIYWFRCFSQIMTSDKLLCLTGRLSPSLSLTLSMALRFIPLFGRQLRKTTDAQRAMGLFREDNIIDSIRSRIRIFSIFTTWALENSIVTAASMEARGCGCCRRTSYSRQKISAADIVIIAAEVMLFAAFAVYSAAGRLDFVFYPHLVGAPVSGGIPAYISVIIMAFLPSFTEIGARLKWKYLELKI